MLTKRILVSGFMTALALAACDDDDPSTGPGDDTSVTSDATTTGPTGTLTTTTTTSTTTAPGGNTGATGIYTDTSDFGSSATTNTVGETDGGVTGSTSDVVTTDYTESAPWVDGGVVVDAGADAGAFVELSDGEILQVFWTANAGEVTQGEIAFEKADSEDVSEFAQMMVTAHASAQAEVDIVVMEEGIELVPNAVATALQASSEVVIQSLHAAPAQSAAFDILYMRSQVAQHETVLALLRDQLIPQADNEALVELLEAARDDVAAHLSAAQSLVVELEAAE